MPKTGRAAPAHRFRGTHYQRCVQPLLCAEKATTVAVAANVNKAIAIVITQSPLYDIYGKSDVWSFSVHGGRTGTRLRASVQGFGCKAKGAVSKLFCILFVQ